MTNGEIIKSVAGCDSIFTLREVLAIMDAAREDEAIRFRIWCDNNLWVMVAPDLYAQIGGTEITSTTSDAEMGGINSSNSVELKQLYQLYKQSK